MMTQSFRIIAPRLREDQGHRGTFGDLLFSPWPGLNLIVSLAVPVRPDGFGRKGCVTSCRRKLDVGELEDEEGLDVGEAEDTQENGRKDLEDGSSSSHGVNTDVSGFEKLPLEILDLIFQELHIKDILFLGLAYSHLWAVALPYIEEHRISTWGTWAGTSIICVGDESDPLDLPAGLLTASETKELQDGLTEDEEADLKFGWKDHTGQPTTLADLALHRYRINTNLDVSFPLVLSYVATRWRGWRKMPESRRRQIIDDLTRYNDPSIFYPEDRPWILRNLTTKEYVRSEAIAIDPEKIYGPDIIHMGFAHVVISRTCWSTSPKVGMKNANNIHRGVWAGHRFDIIPLDRHEQETAGVAGWKDVSEEIAKEMAGIWENQFGVNWRDRQRVQIARAYW